MKQIISIIAAMMMALSGIAAQSFEFGIKAGANGAMLAGIEGDTPRVAAVGGGTVEWRATKLFSLQAELLYSMQGARCNDSQGVATEFIYNYVNLPVLAKIYPFGQRFALLAGVQFGYLLAPSIEYTTLSGKERIRWRTDLEKGSYNPMEYSVAVGAEWNIRHGIGVDVRYTLGLLQIHYGRSSSTLTDDYITIPDNRNSVAQIALFYRF